ncbi:MAG: hypothetical protein M3Y48_04295 [Actinomycetota bacterium]|nr:hypothetical protein [Actinomycetota bacterium]
MTERHDAIYEITRESQPTGIRFVYYRAVVTGLVPKTDPGYAKVQRALMVMRESERIPYSWIVDSTRWMRKPDSWDTVEQMVEEMSAGYRRNLWSTTDTVVEIWVESESVAGVLYPVTSRWDVPLYPCKGQSSVTFAYEAAQQYKHDHRPVSIYYVGDHDPAGLEIEAQLGMKLRKHSGRDDLTLRRLACTPEQVARFDLPGTQPKKSSYRDPISGLHVPWSGQAVEVEALEPNYLRGLVEDAITSHIDPHELALHRMVEDQERAGLEALAGGWNR